MDIMKATEKEKKWDGFKVFNWVLRKGKVLDKRLVKLLEQIKQGIDSLKLENPQDQDLFDQIEKIRAKFKQKLKKNA